MGPTGENEERSGDLGAYEDKSSPDIFISDLIIYIKLNSCFLNNRCVSQPMTITTKAIIGLFWYCRASNKGWSVVSQRSRSVLGVLV